MVKKPDEAVEQPPQNFKDEFIKVITQLDPNIKWKDLQRHVATYTVEIQRLAELQRKEDKEAGE